MCEVTVILKREDKTYKEKFLCYESITIGEGIQDAHIQGYIDEAKKNMQGEPEEVTIKISLSL